MPCQVENLTKCPSACTVYAFLQSHVGFFFAGEGVAPALATVYPTLIVPYMHYLCSHCVLITSPRGTSAISYSIKNCKFWTLEAFCNYLISGPYMLGCILFVYLWQDSVYALYTSNH